MELLKTPFIMAVIAGTIAAVLAAEILHKMGLQK